MSLLRLAAALAVPFPQALWAQVVPVPAAPVQAVIPGTPADFPATTRQMLERYKAAEKDYLRAIDGVVSIPASRRTFSGTLGAVENAQAAFSEAMDPGSFLSAVSPSKNIRRMAEAIDRRASRVSLAVSNREDLYRAIREYADKGEALSGEEKKLLDETLRDYKKMGMDLPLERREEIRRMRQRLSDLAQAFEHNLANFEDGIDLTREQLEGMSEDYVAGLPKNDDGTYRVGLDYPSYLPFMTLAKDAGLRRRLQFKFFNKAAEKNVPILEEVLTLRQKMARALGYANYAEYAVSDRMAAKPEAVTGFLGRLKDMLKEPAAADRAAMLEKKRQDDPSAENLESWDVMYYADKLMKEKYSFDPEEARQYFPVDTVVSGALKFYQDLLGLSFREVREKAWHEDVRLFEILDKDGGRPVGYFYLDIHPRQGKFGHAAAFTIIRGREIEGGYRMPVSAMVSNFSKPTPGKPALLTHDEVVTFFHEFGHLMHQTLTRARFPSFSGTSVARDFVEAPSQLMENFAWLPEVLAMVSGHYQDPARKLPPELLARMLAARNFNSGYSTLRQVALASLDWAYHTLPSPVDTTAVMKSVLESIQGGRVAEGTHFQAGFGHLMGYAAGYYSYLWALVFAQDMFSRFEREGVLNPATGMDYRKKILERGSSVKEAESLKEFLGREPDEAAFIRGLGIPSPKS